MDLARINTICYVGILRTFEKKIATNEIWNQSFFSITWRLSQTHCHYKHRTYIERTGRLKKYIILYDAQASDDHVNHYTSIKLSQKPE